MQQFGRLLGNPRIRPASTGDGMCCIGSFADNSMNGNGAIIDNDGTIRSQGWFTDYICGGLLKMKKEEESAMLNDNSCDFRKYISNHYY